MMDSHAHLVVDFSAAVSRRELPPPPWSAVEFSNHARTPDGQSDAEAGVKASLVAFSDVGMQLAEQVEPLMR